MAITLTKSYQKIAEVNIGVATGSKYHILRLYGRYTSQSTIDNATTVQYQLRHYTPTDVSITYYSSSQKITGDVTASSSNVQNKKFSEGETILLTKSKTISHKTDGSKSISVGGSFTNSYFGNTVTIKNTTVNLPKINRIATVTSASDFTDEENPVLEFLNPTDYDATPYLLFYDDNNELVHEVLSSSKATNSPYVWDITPEERHAIWKATNKQQKYKVEVGLVTTNGSEVLGNHSKSQTMTYVDAQPTYTYEIIDENTKVTNLLGDSAEYLVQNVSQPKIIIHPSAKKEATIKNVTISYNGIGSLLQTEPYEKSYVANSTDFLVRVYDSRMFYVGQDTIQRNIIEYSPIDISSHSFKRQSPTSSNIILNAEIRYKQATFGSTANVPTIQWKLGASGTFKTLSASDYTIDSSNNKIIISNLVLEDALTYTSEGDFYLYVNDLLTEDEENAFTVTKGIPTCDMGEHDFKVNGELYLADQEGKNKKEIRDLFFPIGSTYITPENVSPASYLGGEWELFDKGFKNSHESDTSIFTPVSSACNVSACAIIRAGNMLRIRLGVETAETFTDTNVELGTLDFSKIGITSTSYTPIPLCGTSNDDGIGRVQLMYNTGTVTWLSLIGETASLPANATVTMDVTIPVGYKQMIDSFCDKFYWKRKA